VLRRRRRRKERVILKKGGEGAKNVGRSDYERRFEIG